jgi:hypothetical protein
MRKKNTIHDNGNILFLSDDLLPQEINKVMYFVFQANEIIYRHFGTMSNFDLIICNGHKEMQTQIMSKLGSNGIVQWQQKHNPQEMSNSVAMTDYVLEKIIIRHDIAKFGHYLLELMLSVLDRSHTHQLREALAWYYTLKVTEQFRYVRPSYPIWIDYLYVTPIKRLSKIVGDDFLRDLAVGRASIEESAFPADIRKLFMPEEMFYC